ncbi:MAG: thiamine-phosphate kinase [Gemmataceae bacterium]|nr:thiamine-phosphate kinase [Gemmataceae bacterium]
MAEFDFINWLRTRTPSNPRVIVGPGDDTAVLAPLERPVLVTTDMLMDGTDFILAEVGPRVAGRKAMAVNLSDIAAMAGEPIAAVVSVALPKSGGRALGEELTLGLRESADEFGVAVVGGDTNSWDGRLVISVTLLGEATSRGPVLRSGARPGDWVFVTGPLGGSIRGHHLTFTPRVREALRLHVVADLHAMIDVSDGLAADLNHILEESRCGAVIAADAVPLADAAVELGRTSGKSPLEHALGDGEDFELLFTVSAADGERLLRDQPVPGVTLTKIGECVDSGLWLEENGTRRPLAPAGWVHALD